MRTTRWKWSGAALLALAALCGRAEAGVGSPSYLNIDVTVSASKSVSVSGAASSTDTTTSWTGTPNQAVAPTSTVTVQNDSGVLTEGWQLSTNANSLSTSAQTWARATSTSSVGADQFAVQAVFGSSNTTTCASASWTDGAIAPPLTTSGVSYTSGGTFADSALNSNGRFNPDASNNLLAYNAATGAGQRALCWRVIMPASTLAPNAAVENIQVIVTAN